MEEGSPNWPKEEGRPKSFPKVNGTSLRASQDPHRVHQVAVGVGEDRVWLLAFGNLKLTVFTRPRQFSPHEDLKVRRSLRVIAVSGRVSLQ